MQCVALSYVLLLKINLRNNTINDHEIPCLSCMFCNVLFLVNKTCLDMTAKFKIYSQIFDLTQLS